MNNLQMRKILADKFKDEGCGFGWADIALLKQETEYEEDVAVWKLVIQGYEHIHFIIHLSKTKMFGNEVWVAERNYFGDEEPESKIVAMEDSKKLDHDSLLRPVLLRIGYHIANTF